MTTRDTRAIWGWGALVALLAANVLVFAFLFFPARQARLDFEGRTRDLEQQVRSLQREGRSSENILTAMRDVEEFSRGFPGRTDLVGLMGRLTKLASSLALHVPDTDYRPAAMKETGLTKVTVQMGVDGPYEKLRRFLYELEGLRRFLVIERLSIKDLKGTAGVQAQLQLGLYLR